MARVNARQDVFDCIAMLCNPKCKNLSNGVRSPVDFETQHEMRIGGI